MATDALVLQLLGDDPHALAPTFRHWFSSSRRFRTFVEQYQSKIRSKLRAPADAEALQDLLFELAIAHWLLQEKRFQLAYELQPLRTAPAPDFTVSFTTKLDFYVEVTRVRATAEADSADPPGQEALLRKLLYVIAGKLHQLQAGAPNLLMIGLASELIASLGVEEIIKQLKARIESNDVGLLAHSRSRTTGAFFKQYAALSGILFYPLRGLPATELAFPRLWLNKAARYPLLTQVQTILRQLPAPPDGRLVTTKH